MGLSRLFPRWNNRTANKNAKANKPSPAASTAATRPTPAASTATARTPTPLDRHYAMKDDGLGRFMAYKTPRLPVLIDILSLNRHPNSPGLDVLLNKYIDTLPGVEEDNYGNRYVTVGDYPTVMWTSHMDTVSDDPHLHRHQLCYNAEEDVLFRKDGNILGADDGTGIWLMMEMIEAGVPGLYAFFLDEETGRKGSRWAANNDPFLFHDFDYCVSFDRKGTSDIVGTQKGGKKCCSDAFQEALAGMMRNIDINARTKASGSFTDSASFMEIIPECTNLCVGYEDQHTEFETQKVGFAIAMRNFLVKCGEDFALLPVDRVPAPEAPPSYVGYTGYTGAVNSHYYDSQIPVEDDIEIADMGLDQTEFYALTDGDMTHMCDVFPEAVASILDMVGFTADDVAEYISNAYYGMDNIRNADS